MSNMPNTPWVIELYSPQMALPIKVRLETRLTVGRGIPGSSKQPDIDLFPYTVEEHAVSRQHIAIFAENYNLMIIDLESEYGTFLNGERLKPNVAYHLEYGNKLKLGNLNLEIHFIISPIQGSGMRKQPTVQLQTQAERGNGELILIVEDDPEVANVLSLIMERHGYRTRVTHEVVGAIRAFNQKRPAAILLDLMLPDLNGLEFCRYVRRDTIQNTIPIIIVSADRSSGNMTESMQAGADIFLTKPVSAHELRQAVGSLIQQHNTGNMGTNTKQLVGTAPLTAIPLEIQPFSVVIFVAGYHDSPFTVSVQQSVSFGRTPSTHSFKTHIDMTKYNAAESGVSRLHMFLHCKDGRFYIEDAASTNGTFRNGNPMNPREFVEIQNGDEVRLGELRMYIYFLQGSEEEED